MAMQTTIELFFNGTGLQAMHTQDELIEMSNKLITKLLKDLPMKDAIDYCYREMELMEKEICDHVKDGMYDLKSISKMWGSKSATNYVFWMSYIIFLVKVKRIPNDNNNGWSIFTTSEQFLRDYAGGRTTSLASIWRPCTNCNTKGYHKKCSGCKKVHYCSAECQKTHWKTHKPECHC
jgi:hypothetical protein